MFLLPKCTYTMFEFPGSTLALMIVSIPLLVFLLFFFFIYVCILNWEFPIWLNLLDNKLQITSVPAFLVLRLKAIYNCILFFLTIFVNHSILLHSHVPLPSNPFTTPSPNPTMALSSLSFVPTHSPSLTLLLQHPSTLGHQTPIWLRVYPSIDTKQGHPLLLTYLEPWIPPCTLLGWWSSLREHWVVRPTDFVLPMELQSPSAPPVLLPALPLGSLSSVSWLALSIHLCFGEWLVKPPKEQPHQIPVSKLLLAMLTVSSLVSTDMMDPQVGQSPNGPSFSLCSISCSCSSFGQEHSRVKNFEMGEWPHPLTGRHAYVLDMVSTGSVSSAHFS
jgi:hypothetical protein